MQAGLNVNVLKPWENQDTIKTVHWKNDNKKSWVENIVQY